MTFDRNRKTDSAVGKILRANVDRLLAERGLSVNEFCRGVGISRQVYSRTFKRRYGPRLARLQLWADTLGVPINDLIKRGGR